MEPGAVDRGPSRKDERETEVVGRERARGRHRQREIRPVHVGPALIPVPGVQAPGPVVMKLEPLSGE